jgi:glycine cleavage system H protein
VSTVRDDRRYTKEHEWIKVEGDRGRVGITDHAQNQLGDLVFLELPAVGRTLAAGEIFGTVESVKAVSELYSPVAGEVVEAHAELVKEPSPINTEPYDGGWMIVVRLADPAAVNGLMDASQYTAYVEKEAK